MPVTFRLQFQGQKWLRQFFSWKTPMPIEFVVLVAGSRVFFNWRGGSANFGFMGAGIF